MPADGIYAAWLVRGRRARRAAARPPSRSAPTPPSPAGSGGWRRTSLDFAGDLYGERVGLDFVAHLREQRRYDAIEPLVAQIDEDVAADPRGRSGSTAPSGSRAALRYACGW